MRIVEVTVRAPCKIIIRSEDGRTGEFDLTPYLGSEAFAPLLQEQAFARVRNGGYFIEWECGADLSADTIEAHWLVTGTEAAPSCETDAAGLGQRTAR